MADGPMQFLALAALVLAMIAALVWLRSLWLRVRAADRGVLRFVRLMPSPQGLPGSGFPAVYTISDKGAAQSARRVLGSIDRPGRER